MRREIELLAPAGSFEALRAAVQNGANAIYLGGAEFSARAYASNFDREQLEEAVDYAHMRGVKIYVTVNTLIKDREMEGLLGYITFLYQIDVDAIIVQDLGLVKILRETLPEFEVHCSTQMTLHNSEGVKLLKNMGMSRVVLARELSLEEIKTIYQTTEMELEVFVHGALCVSYSGQCLMSSLIGGRSGNRGRCAQPCRRMYELYDLEKGEPVQPIDSQAFHMSMRDLNTFDHIHQLIDSGVTSFKIEGRMKKPQYVASIVGSYRQAIDHYLEHNQAFKDEELQWEMEQMFNRKFTKGYLFNSQKTEVINIQKPNNRGVSLGEVMDYHTKTKKMKIKLLRDIEPGDGIEVWGQKKEEIGGSVKIQGSKGQVVEIEMRGNIQPGDEVYKTLDISLNKELEKTYHRQVENRKINIRAEIKVELGNPCELSLWDDRGNTAFVKSDFIVEAAQKVAVDKEKIVKNVSKLGDTPYHLENVQVTLDPNVSVPLSVINDIRRKAIEIINAQRNVGYKGRPDVIPHLPMLNDIIEDKYSHASRRKGLVVKCDSIMHLREVVTKDVHRVYYGDFKTLQVAIDLCHGKKIEIYFKSPSIIKDQEMTHLVEGLSKLKIDGVLAGDLGMLNVSIQNLKIPTIADYSLNIFNSYTAQLMADMGAKGMTPSLELTLREMKGLKSIKGLDTEAVSYGKLPIMTMEYCPLVQVEKCDQQCAPCKYYQYDYRWGLKDHKDIIFPFTKDYWGRTILFNGQTLYLADKLSDFKDLKVKWLRLEFTDETKEDVTSTITQYEKGLMGKEEPLKKKQGTFTRGHYYRGVE
ncbi:peptidase U32 [Alkaliphilus metalliredigens QYMF]|uniref:Peptidase U32 n=1 Tax=Alkaliphilus metalliredigens (strain QYMF) TaxID=293826 RepID=A6TNQ1_ALKMQ|nr:U32 family peptidase [Alkaliphilus metalliredigens]ABR47819.1 peptidase U32 [Alkaliphilus metalliredigens QYMF]